MPRQRSYLSAWRETLINVLYQLAKPRQSPGLGGADRTGGLPEDRGSLFDGEPGHHPQLEYLLVPGGQPVECQPQLCMIIGDRGGVTRCAAVLDHLGHPAGDPVLATQPGQAAVVVGADPAGDPEHPAVETCWSGPVFIYSANGANHGFAHGVFNLTGIYSPGDESPQARIKAPVEHLPGSAVSGAGGGDKCWFVEMFGLVQVRQNCANLSFLLPSDLPKYSYI